MRSHSFKKLGKYVLIGSAAFAASLVGVCVATGWILIRPSRRSRFDGIALMRYGRLHSIQLFTVDGLRLHAWVLLSRFAQPADWVIQLHGYNSDRTAPHRRMRFFARRGFNVLMLHFRGHGSSEAARISYGYNERKDVEAAFKFLRSLRVGAPLRIGISGISMGAAAAAYAVGNGTIDPAWMILESCYDNIRHALENRLALRVSGSLAPWLAWPIETVVQHLVNLRARDLDPAKALEKACCPVLVIAGDSEKVLKHVEIEYLFGCIPGPKQLSLVPGAGHGDLLAANPRHYSRAVGSFLRRFARPDNRPTDVHG
jgi:dipeptidyl aminopeptidase/acylaminoacyl peptidase